MKKGLWDRTYIYNIVPICPGTNIGEGIIGEGKNVG